jgi:polyphosphate kinase
MVVRDEGGVRRTYCHLGTGNYNDRTARVYSDFGLLTAREEICADVSALFTALANGTPGDDYEHLLVAPDRMRKAFVRMIRREAGHAREGRPARITAKMNSLVDPDMIDELYLAANDGVSIRLIVRGICCLRPGIPGLSGNIEVCSIIDRYLEHARVYRFENGGDPVLYLASADWMPRNLNGRIEVAFPVLDQAIRAQIDRILELQLSDSVKARLLNADGSCVRRTGGHALRSQFAAYDLANAFAAMRRPGVGNSGHFSPSD